MSPAYPLYSTSLQHEDSLRVYEYKVRHATLQARTPSSCCCIPLLSLFARLLVMIGWMAKLLPAKEGTALPCPAEVEWVVLKGYADTLCSTLSSLYPPLSCQQRRFKPLLCSTLLYPTLLSTLLSTTGPGSTLD